MKKERITRVTLEEVMKMKDRTRKDAPPGPPLPNDFWKHAKVVYPESPKEAVKIRYDRDMLEWFKTQGHGYQTRMNAVLRSYYEAHKDEPTAKRSTNRRFSVRGTLISQLAIFNLPFLLSKSHIVVSSIILETAVGSRKSAQLLVNVKIDSSPKR